MSNWYTTRERVRAKLGFASADRTDLNPAIDRVIEHVSRAADLHCGTHFFVRNRTRYLTYEAQRRDTTAPLLLHAELVGVTSLKTDNAGDRTYATTWATTDYDLHPENAPYESPPAPYWAIYRAPSGVNGWLTSRRGIQLTGKWGHYEVLERSTATVAEAVDLTETAIDVSDASVFEVGMTILIDSEQLFITAVDTASSPDKITTAPRVGLNGTTPATHLSGAAIDVYTYHGVDEPVLIQCHRHIEGTIGRPNRSEQEAVARAYARLDRDVRGSLDLMRYRGP